MQNNYKPLPDQTIIINGAATPLGREVTNLALAHGARVVLAVPSDELIQEMSDLTSRNGFAVFVKSTGNAEADFKRIADSAVRTFGGFDCWINITGSTLAGNTLELNPGDLKQNGDTAFWTVVFGSRIAATHFIETQRNGTIINVYSNMAQSEANMPIYFALRQAVKGWTDGFRAEVEKVSDRVSVSLIQPGRNELRTSPNGEQTSLPGRPEVAAAVLYCATHRKPEMYVGPQSKIGSIFSGFTPRISTPKKDTHEGTAQVTGDEKSAETPNHESIHDALSETKKYLKKAAKNPLISSIIFAGIGAGLWMFSKKKK